MTILIPDNLNFIFQHINFNVLSLPQQHCRFFFGGWLLSTVTLGGVTFATCQQSGSQQISSENLNYLSAAIAREGLVDLVDVGGHGLKAGIEAIEALLLDLLKGLFGLH